VKRLLLVATLLCVLVTSGAAKAPPLQSVIFEGPSGRLPLTEWVLRKDPGDRGEALGWTAGGFAGSTVALPNVVDPTPFSGRAGARNYRGALAWYRTSIQTRSPGLYALDFQSANYLASVWIDGHAVGSHRGSYLPFGFVRRLSAGTHTLVVRVDWRNPARQAREGFHRTWFNWGGLNGEVDLRALGQSDLQHPAIQTTLSPAGQATVTVSVEIHNYGTARTVTPHGSLQREGAAIPLGFPELQLAAGQTRTATATATVERPALWTPASPSLYQLELAVPGESSYNARVGLRQISWHGGAAYLNGARLRLHGATVQEDTLGHGDALSPADQEQIVQELKQIGANVVRAQHPLDPALLERLDANGLLVWQGIGPVEGAGMWYSTTPALLAAAEAQARTAVGAAQLHPSIFAWNLVDEVARNGRDQAEVAYVTNTGRWLHSHDPGRMVAVDVWGSHPPTQAGPIYSEADAIAETDYTGWYNSPHASPAEQMTQMRQRLNAMARTFAGKVLVISEFGAESNAKNREGAPGSYAFQSNLLARHIKVYEEDPRLSAMMIWLLRDYPLTPEFSGGSIHRVIKHLKLIEGINGKGLFAYGGKPKPAVGVIARLFKALPAG
jgi:Glycosyl hydrolases family 2, TIM barrel domain/Glycosyl hydrolases family 2